MANDVKFIFVLGTLFVCTWLFLMLPRNDTQQSAYGVTGENIRDEECQADIVFGSGPELQMESAPVVRDNTMQVAQRRVRSDVPAVILDTDRQDMPGQVSFTSYTVKKGDTLCKISRKFFQTDARWRTIYEANRETVPSPDVLPEGVVLRIPEP